MVPIKKSGPLTVSIDSQRCNMFEKNKVTFEFIIDGRGSAEEKVI